MNKIIPLTTAALLLTGCVSTNTKNNGSFEGTVTNGKKEGHINEIVTNRQNSVHEIFDRIPLNVVRGKGTLQEKQNDDGDMTPLYSSVGGDQGSQDSSVGGFSEGLTDYRYVTSEGNGVYDKPLVGLQETHVEFGLISIFQKKVDECVENGGQRVRRETGGLYSRVLGTDCYNPLDEKPDSLDHTPGIM